MEKKEQFEQNQKKQTGSSGNEFREGLQGNTDRSGLSGDDKDKIDTGGVGTAAFDEGNEPRELDEQHRGTTQGSKDVDTEDPENRTVGIP